MNATLIGYKVEIARANTFATLVATEIVNSPSLSLPTLVDGVYYWRVRSLFAPNNVLGPVSPVFSFKIDRAAPSSPSLVLPIANSMVMTTHMPTFTWLAAAGNPTQYVLEIDDEASFNSVWYQATVTTLSHKLPVLDALPNWNYFWRVRAKDAAGNVSIGAVRLFTIAAP